MRWFERQRIAWIAEALAVFGYVNRYHLIRKFGVSQAQASMDLQTFQKHHPGAMAYNKSTKRYEATKT